MVIVVTGPTATGKSDLGIYLAQKLNGEIINADSTQIYKGMNICTNKIKDNGGIIHHLFDFKDLSDDYTVYDFQRECREVIEDILSRGKTPILVGGTGLYINAALYDYEFENIIRDDYSDLSNEEVYEKLIEVDPKTSIHKNNRKRVVNALNYYKATGNPYSLKSKKQRLLYDTIFIGLTTDRDNLYNRIDKRVDDMVKEGLIEEARQLYDSKIFTKAVMTPIGPKELFEYFDGKRELSSSIDLIKQRSRRYAKRQYTWFKNQMSLRWFEVDYNNFENTCVEVMEYIKSME